MDRGTHGPLVDYSRHDLLLAMMALPLLLGAAVGLTTPASLTLALGVGCLFALPVFVYAVYVDPPVASEHRPAG